MNQDCGWGSEETADTAALAMVPADPGFVSHVALLDVARGAALASVLALAACGDDRGIRRWSPHLATVAAARSTARS